VTKTVSEKRPDSLWIPIKSDEKLVRHALRLTERDLESAGRVLKDNDYDWSFAIAYSAMLQAGRALMFADGFRPRGEFKHVAVVEFVKQKCPDFAGRLLDSFDRSRKRRHTVVYDEADTVSKEEAERAVAVAGEFVEKAKELIGKKWQL